MVTCYQDLTWKYTYMVSQNLYPTLNQWSVNLLMKWHHDDPVSQKEMDRNEAVYKIQNNRNPFIDMPELADYLWGDKKGEPFKPGSITIPDTGAPELYAPVTNMTVDFGQVAEGKSVTSKVLVKGKYLKGTVDCQIYRDDADMFKAATASIPASLVCSEDGYWLNVVYTPTSLGQHTSRLLLSGDFGSIGVELRGECLAVPVLTACTATAPSDVMADRYTANWEAPAGEVIDYFVVTRTTYAGSKVNTEELLAEDTWLEILGFEDSDREAYSVQSVRLGYRSPMSNVIFIDHTGINGVTVEEPLVIQTFPGAIRFICSRPQTGCRIYNVSGMLVDTIDYVEQNTDHELPTGVYFITTDTHPTPVKVYVR